MPSIARCQIYLDVSRELAQEARILKMRGNGSYVLCHERSQAARMLAMLEIDELAKRGPHIDEVLRTQNVSTRRILSCGHSRVKSPDVPRATE